MDGLLVKVFTAMAVAVNCISASSLLDDDDDDLMEGEWLVNVFILGVAYYVLWDIRQ